MAVILEGYKAIAYEEGRRHRLNNNLEKDIYYNKVRF